MKPEGDHAHRIDDMMRELQLAKVHAPPILRIELLTMIVDAVTPEEFDYACQEAASHGCTKFAYVRAVVARRLRERADDPEAGSNEDGLVPLSLVAYRDAARP